MIGGINHVPAFKGPLYFNLLTQLALARERCGRSLAMSPRMAKVTQRSCCYRMMTAHGFFHVVPK